MLGRSGDQFNESWERHTATIAPGFVSRDELGYWLTACDALVLPFRDTVHNRGRWPGKVNDYLAAGRPIISTAVGDIQDVLGNYPVGIMSEPTGESLGEAIIEAIDSHERRRSMGEAARNLAENDLSWERIGARLQHMLESL
jgi:glycosyltransferase involved in cell wall biosynthesis